MFKSTAHYIFELLYAACNFVKILTIVIFCFSGKNLPADYQKSNWIEEEVIV